MIAIQLAIILVALVGFLHRYATRFQWRRYWQGRMLVFQKVVLIATAVFYIVKPLIQPREVGQAVEHIVLGLLGIAVWGMYLALIESQRHMPASQATPRHARRLARQRKETNGH